jgi:hypothetical protein
MNRVFFFGLTLAYLLFAGPMGPAFLFLNAKNIGTFLSGGA